LASANSRAATRRTNGSGGVARGAMSNANDDPDGMQMGQIDTGGIMAQAAAKQKSLFPCLREEVGRNPDLAAKIPVEFVVANDGKVATFWVDNPQFKSGLLYDCLLREAKKWQFKPYQGERATVNFTLRVGKNR
jgi:hypothetical protein